MELIDVYTNDLDNYTLREFIMEQLLDMGRKIECKEDVYSEIAVLTETDVDDVIAYLNHSAKPPKIFLESVEYHYDIKYKHLDGICKKIASNKRRIEHNKAQRYNRVDGKMKISNRLNKFKREASRRHHQRMEMFEKLDAELPRDIRVSDRNKIITEKMELTECTAKRIRDGLRIWKRMVKRYGRLENTIPTIERLIKNGHTPHEISRFIGASITTVRKVDRIMKEKQSALDKQA